jgi:hypothetical protein
MPNHNFVGFMGEAYDEQSQSDDPLQALRRTIYPAGPQRERENQYRIQAMHLRQFQRFRHPDRRFVLIMRGEISSAFAVKTP